MHQATFPAVVLLGRHLRFSVAATSAARQDYLLASGYVGPLSAVAPAKEGGR